MGLEVLEPLMAEPPRILIVDDLPANLELLTNLLEPQGYRVERATDGQDAVDQAFTNAPDLILMDVNMPRLSGLEACRRLKADSRTHFVPVVLITGLSAREDRIQGIGAGCDDFLTKPIDVEELLVRARTLLRAKFLVDELEQAENVPVNRLFPEAIAVVEVAADADGINARIERPRRLPGERVGAERDERQLGMGEDAVERLLSRISRSARDRRRQHGAYYAV